MKLTDVQNRLTALREYRQHLKIPRAELARVLGVSWPRVNQLLPKFEVEGEGDELKIVFASVESYYAKTAERLVQADKRQLKFPLQLQPQSRALAKAVQSPRPAGRAARPQKKRS